jgi:hypothetical protein
MDQLFSLVPSEHMHLIRDALSHVTGFLNIDASQAAGSLMMLGIAAGVCFILFRILLLVFKLGLLAGALYFLTFFIGTNETDTTSFVIPNNTSQQNSLLSNLMYAQASSKNTPNPKPGAQQIPAMNVPFISESTNMNSLPSWEVVSDKINDTLALFKEYELSIKKKESY